MADYGGIGGGGSLRDALNQAYPLTNLGGISTGFPPQAGPPRVGMTARPVPSQAQPVIPPIPPVPAPTGAAPPIPGAPPNPQDDSAAAGIPQQLLRPGDPREMALIARLFQGQQGGGPPNYAAQLGLTRPY